MALAPGVLTDRWSEVVEDPEIQIIIETIGGIEPARTYIIQALNQALRSGSSIRLSQEREGLRRHLDELETWAQRDIWGEPYEQNEEDMP